MTEGHRRACLAVSRVGLGTKESLPAFCEIFGKLGCGGGDGVKVQGGLRLVWGVFFSSAPPDISKGGYLALLPTYGRHLSHNVYYGSYF